MQLMILLMSCSCSPLSQRYLLDEVAAQMVSAAEDISIPPRIAGLARKAPDKSRK